MPELPDIEVVVERLSALVVHTRVTDISFFRKKRIVPNPEILRNLLIDKRIQKVSRLGKQVIFHFEDDITLHIKLMLKGRISIQPSPLRQQFTIMLLKIGEKWLAINDETSLCTLTLGHEKNNEQKTTDAPDALDANTFTWVYFKGIALNAKRASIKSVITNQRLISGIGNAYADEILWYARVDPRSIASRIPETYVKAIYDNIFIVLNDAICNLRNCCSIDEIFDNRSFFAVHRKDIDKTPTGNSIIKEIASGKTTYFSDDQKLFL